MALNPHSYGAAITAAMNQLVEKSDFSGSVLAAKDGAVLFKQSYGCASREHGVLNTPSTKYRIWSITKLFTASVVIMLHEKGLLDLDQSIADISQKLSVFDHTITVRQLLNHTSGIYSYTDSEEFARRGSKLPMGREEMLRHIHQQPCVFLPGAACAYNNSAYYLLGIIIECLTGEHYETYVKRTILEPSGMYNTGLDNNSSIISSLATGYSWDRDEGIRKSEYVDIETAFSAGGLYSTVEDLYLWDRELHAGRLISKRMQEQMLTPYLDGYGLGWKIEGKHGRRRVGHSGAYRGFRAELDRYLDDNATVIILSNLDAPVEEIRDSIAAILLQ